MPFLDMKENQGLRQKYTARKNPTSPYPSVAPKVPSSVDVIFHRLDPSIVQQAIAALQDQIVTSQILYKPALLGLARVTFHGRRSDIRQERELAKVVPFPNISQITDWENNLVKKWDNRNGRSSPETPCFYQVDHSYDFSVTRFEELQEEFIQFLVTSEILELYYNPYLKLYRRIDESPESFSERCLEMIHENFKQEIRTLEDGILRQEDRLKERLEREVRELSSDQLEAQPEYSDEPAITEMKTQVAELERMKEAKLKELEQTQSTLSRQQENDLLRLNRSDVEVLRFSLVWLPYTEYVIQENDRRRLQLIQSF